MKGHRYICCGCHISQEISGELRICKHCAKDVDGIQKVMGLIFRKFPKMTKYTMPEIFLRLWMTMPAVKADQEAMAAAKELEALFQNRVRAEPPKTDTPEGRAKHAAWKASRDEVMF